jgi:aminocarboxymuconate-semialdehyde decarboxylase
VNSLDVHFHVVPPAFVDAVRRGMFADAVHLERAGGVDRMVYHAPPDVVLEPGTTLPPALYDERLILDALARRGLDGAVIGPSPEEFYYWTAPAVGARIAAEQNDGMAELARAHADRLVGLATLPMQDPGRAARELERAVTELGLRGAEICTHVNGRDLDHPDLGPVYEAAERLRVPLFLHPQNWGDMRRLEDHHLWNLVGFPTETALAAARLILGGVFDRFPGLNVILPHGGGYFPYQVGRLDHGYEVRREARERLPRRPSEYLGNLYCDSLTHNALSLRFLIDRMGDGHVVIGSDYPFTMGDERPVATVRDLGLAPAVEAKVLAKNLAGVLGL